ncbi:MAG: caspase family protein [Bacteroidetes bacterium]|nr:caspase family protein [Bacteroidota bacterium]
MNFKIFSILLITLLLASVMSGQTLRSEKVFFKLEEPKQRSVESSVKEVPGITFLSPSVNESEVFDTDQPEIQILAQISSSTGLESVVLNSRIVEPSSDGKVSQRLDLFPGENTIIIGALAKGGGYSEKRMRIKYSPRQVSLAEKVNNESLYYALIIGIDNYMDPAIASLDNAVRDANRIKEVLLARYTFNKGTVTLLENPRREDIIYALENLARRVTTKDNLFIYYAGHGNFDKKANIGYWLPSNARKISSAEWFNNSQLVDYLKRIDTRHTLLVSDACFSGSIFTMRTAFSDASMAVEKLYDLPSRKAMTSGRVVEVPDESAFSRYLIDRLAKNKDLYYSTNDLFNNIRTAVINNSETVPQYGEIRNVGDEGGEFIFIRK